jgi:hypothetical protein
MNEPHVLISVLKPNVNMKTAFALLVACLMLLTACSYDDGELEPQSTSAYKMKPFVLPDSIDHSQLICSFRESEVAFSALRRTNSIDAVEKLTWYENAPATIETLQKLSYNTYRSGQLHRDYVVDNGRVAVIPSGQCMAYVNLNWASDCPEMAGNVFVCR